TVVFDAWKNDKTHRKQYQADRDDDGQNDRTCRAQRLAKRISEGGGKTRRCAREGHNRSFWRDFNTERGGRRVEFQDGPRWSVRVQPLRAAPSRRRSRLVRLGRGGDR